MKVVANAAVAEKNDAQRKKKLKTTSLKSVMFLCVFIAVFSLFAVPMGLANALNTMMNTAYRLLIDTTLYIMAIAVLAGAVSALFSEYGVIELLNKIPVSYTHLRAHET